MSRYNDIKIFRNQNNKRFYGCTKYPDIPLDFSDIYVYATEGDRYDTLAQSYYGDPSLWWIISTANPNVPKDSLIIPLGRQIRIPTDVGRIISFYNDLNNDNSTYVIKQKK